jgi:hypothetical protein
MSRPFPIVVGIQQWVGDSRGRWEGKRGERGKCADCSAIVNRDDLYLPGFVARHASKAGVVVRIIFHPSPTRFAISGAVAGLMPQGTLCALQAFSTV